MGILKNECHLHLYGCLDKKELWHHLHSRIIQFKPRFEWYLSEHQRLIGNIPRTDLWSNADRGFELFTQDFVCDRAMPFDAFQAKFNLLIALFPPRPDDMTLPRCVFSLHQPLGGYKEYRLFLPLYLSAEDRALYLRRVIETAREYETNTYHPKIAISFQRQDDEAWNSYEFLSRFLAENPDMAPWITGIDFCASERGHPPLRKKPLFQRIIKDRIRSAQRLEILYHVGEMWQNIALHSAARWCAETARLGVKRIGHAMALGMNPESLRGHTICETAEETAHHLAWLRRHGQALHEYGFSRIDYAWVAQRAERVFDRGETRWRYDDELIQHTTLLQGTLMRMVADTGAMIECCPSSNMRIGGLMQPSHHPLRSFLNHHIPITISTDDPGIFDLTLEGEEAFVRANFGISNHELQTADQLAAQVIQG